MFPLKGNGTAGVGKVLDIYTPQLFSSRRPLREKAQEEMETELYEQIG